jgi:hypothetical protein
MMSFDARLRFSRVLWGIALFATTGCGSHWDYDVAKEGEEIDLILNNPIYFASRDLFVVRSAAEGVLALAPPAGTIECAAVLYPTPDSIESYRHEMERWTDVVGTVAVDTGIRIDRIGQRGRIGFGSTDYASARVLDGEWKDKLVDVTALFDLCAEEDDFKPNPQFITRRQ